MDFSLNTVPPNFCPAPFSNLVQDQLGHSGPCPYNGGCWDYREVPAQERWNHPQADQTRHEFLNNQRPSSCMRCFLEEEGGFKSRRLQERQFSQVTFEELKSGQYRKGPKTMVLRLSNICNYACRTCSSGDSGLFRPEGAFYAEAYGDLDNRYLEKIPRKELSEEEIGGMVAMTENLERLEFFGGEPMLNRTHNLLLRNLVESGRAPGITLFYCTNGSHYPDEGRISLWKHFKTIILAFSLDGVGDWYHFLRWPGNWDKVKKNILRFKKELPLKVEATLQYQANITVSSMNIFNLPEIFSTLRDLRLECHTTTVFSPEYYSIKNIPEPVKKMIGQKLMSHKKAKFFKGMVSFMNSSPCRPEKWREFVLWTEKKDAFRGQSFKKTFSEYYSHLRPYYEEAVSDFKAQAPRP